MFNNVNIILFSILCVTFECNGHLGILSDIIGGAHDRIHSTVDKVAGGILGGLNVNFQGHIGVEGQRYPNKPQPPQGGQQTVIVVVEEDNDNENYGMRPNQYGQGQHNNGNYGMRPNQYGQGNYNNNNNQNRPNNNQYGQGNYNNNNNQNRPGYNQGQWNSNANQQNPYGNQNNGQNHNENQYGNYGRPGQYPNQGQNNYQQRPDENNQGNQNNYGNEGNNQRPDQTSQGNNQGQTTQGYHQTSDGNNNYGQNTTPKQEETRPTFGSIHDEPTEKPVTEKTTEKDEPLFVPLNPNQYIYGGDKVTINAPKRETDNEQKAKDEDEELPIDIRFQDQ